jgi:hypothetical protein
MQAIRAADLILVHSVSFTTFQLALLYIISEEEENEEMCPIRIHCYAILFSNVWRV